MIRSRIIWVVVIGVLASTSAALFLVRAARQARSSEHLSSGVVVDERRLAELLVQPHALFRSTRVGEGYGHIVAAAIEPVDVRLQTGLECDRVDASAGAGVCLTAERGVLTKYWAVTFDAALQMRHRVELPGIPSRVRMSPDGRLAGITVFVSGHGYSNAEFSTSTTLLDVEQGAMIADLEQFAVTRDGRPFKNANFNFWGVTFAADSNLFYATLGSGDRLYLVRGDAAGRSVEVIAEGVECPSLSPDNQRLAYKKRSYDGGRMRWRLAVMDLETMAEQVIEGEPASVDDQVEWLDDRHLLYAIADETPGRGGTTIHKIDIRNGAPAVWADGAYSPAIVGMGTDPPPQP
jgi:hypothetical protein